MWFSIVGNILADGFTIKWQYYKALERLTEDEQDIDYTIYNQDIDRNKEMVIHMVS